MDDFTKNMLERAKLRRQKLNSHLSQAGRTPKPLQESQIINMEPKPVDTSTFSRKVEALSFSTTTPSKEAALSTPAKLRLQQLGSLYSENPEGLSSPISKAEEKMLNEVDLANKPKCRLSRLNKLASTINEWEDDLSHPDLKRKQDLKSDTKENKIIKNEEPPKKTTKSTDHSQVLTSKVEITMRMTQRTPLAPPAVSPGQDKNKTKFGGQKNVLSPSAKAPLNLAKLEVNKKFTPSSPTAKVTSAVTKNAESVNQQSKSPATSVRQRAAMFEKLLNDGKLIDKGGEVKSKLEQNKEIEFLKNRWNKNKTESVETCAQEALIIPPSPPKMPSPSQVCHAVSPVKASPKIGERLSSPRSSPIKARIMATQMKQSPIMGTQMKINRQSPGFASPKSPEPYKDSPETLKAVQSVKEIVLSPPKEGKLYPSLSDIEASGSDSSENSSSDNASEKSNLYLNMSFGDILEASKNLPLTPPRTQESVVINEMDEFLNEALGSASTDDEGPTPPKQSRGISNSDSFEYERGTPHKVQASTPLIRTLSVYRKEQELTSTPSSSNLKISNDWATSPECNDDAAAVKAKISELKMEMEKQTSIMSQASNALSVCMANIEFSGSEEQVEGDRLLLLAENKKKACEHELQRLEVEGTLRPKGMNHLQTNERGNLKISNLTISIKREALRAMAADESMLHFVCLLKSDEKVLATQVVPAKGDNLKGNTLSIPGELKLDNLYCDFKATVEVYFTNLRREVLPPEVKYHLPGTPAGKREKRLLTPSKKKTPLRLVMPKMQSPAGPYTVRSSSFKMCGYVIFSLKETKRTQWTLNRVTPHVKYNESPLEGTMGMKVDCSTKLHCEHRGFLNLFQDVGGLGAWTRFWFLLSGHHLTYWLYPDEEQATIPLGSIDLRAVVTPTVGQAPREICSRKHTFLMETVQPREQHDTASLVKILEGETVRMRHLLCAESKDNAQEWCQHINKALALVRAWSQP